MEIEDIIGGVSPLKARQKGRGGKHAKKATATSKRRGGFAASKGERSGGGRNVGGYNVNTSFTPGPAWVKPADGNIGPAKPNIAQDIINKGKGSEEWEYEDKEATPGTKGNSFRDACYEADGTRKTSGSTGTATWVDENGKTQTKTYLCEWDPSHVSTGSNDYTTSATDPSHRKRKKSTDTEGVVTYSDWEVNTDPKGKR